MSSAGMSAAAGVSAAGPGLGKSRPGRRTKRQSDRANACRNFPTGFRSDSFLGNVSHWNTLSQAMSENARLLNARPPPQFRRHHDRDAAMRCRPSVSLEYHYGDYNGY
jgi:hypothetical protein